MDTWYKLFSKHAYPLLTAKQKEKLDSGKKTAETVSTNKKYKVMLDWINTEVDRLLEAELTYFNELLKVVKAETPRGFKFTINFHGSRYPGFYKLIGNYEPGKRNCVNCIRTSDGKYKVFGTDGYRFGDLLGIGDAEQAAAIANAWLDGGEI